MIRLLLSLFFWLTATVVHAQSCPDFFRFVDFGVQGSDGRFVRGGPHFRGESLSGTTLFNRSQTQCRDVADIASDGHGNPIPVVTQVTYHPEKTGLGLTALSVSYAGSTQAVATQNAQAHRARLNHVGAAPIRGARSLCVVGQDDENMSCQLVSPYGGDVDLVVHCNRAQCVMPVLAVEDHIVISAAWPVPDGFWRRQQDAGGRVLQQIEAIHAFFAPLTSGF